MRSSKLIGRLALALIVALLVLVLLSWLLSATMGQGVHSLLSAEGIRFFLGSFTDMQLQPPLVWLLLLSMSWGCLKDCGLLADYFTPASERRSVAPTQAPPIRRRQALLLMAVILVGYVALILLLSVTPHAVLLSATGGLWPSAFSRALVPLAALGLIVLSAIYGVFTRRFLSFSALCQSLYQGIAAAAPLLLLYLLFMQFYASLRFTFGWA